MTISDPNSSLTSYIYIYYTQQNINGQKEIKKTHSRTDQWFIYSLWTHVDWQLEKVETTMVRGQTSASPLWPLPATEVLIKDDCYCITHGMDPLFQELQTSSFTNQPCITAATPHSCFIWHQSKWNSTSLQIWKIKK